MFAAIREWEASHPASAPSGYSQAFLWALGKSFTAPSSGRQTSAIPTLADARAEIKHAENNPRRRGESAERQDAARTLEWLIGKSDDIPVPGSTPEAGWGHLVGGRGHLLRSDDQIRAVLERARRGPAHARIEWETDWCSGVVATCEWALGLRAVGPASGRPTSTGGRPFSRNDLVGELAPAEDIGWQNPGPGRRHSAGYGDGILHTIGWLMGSKTQEPVGDDCLPP
ncbi:hypothetical protein Pth03_78070 [Planotetraspora thailandica]|uniref:Uncharacterized protein n=1 Tax=Planotetraspora thailandica TaxID=487172 RepID=A0A8J3Y200_9ACTN|nr:hypothetical protein Pth03_78070 [Planotetraspora thailandica]